MDFDAEYDVNAKILNVKFNGQGKLRGNASKLIYVVFNFVLEYVN